MLDNPSIDISLICSGDVLGDAINLDDISLVKRILGDPRYKPGSGTYLSRAAVKGDIDMFIVLWDDKRIFRKGIVKSAVIRPLHTILPTPQEENNKLKMIQLYFEVYPDLAGSFNELYQAAENGYCLIFKYLLSKVTRKSRINWDNALKNTFKFTMFKFAKIDLRDITQDMYIIKGKKKIVKLIIANAGTDGSKPLDYDTVREVYIRVLRYQINFLHTWIEPELMRIINEKFDNPQAELDYVKSQTK